MTIGRISAWIRANGWPIAFVAMIFGGYSVGKDVAMRDNEVDRIKAGER